MINSVTLVGRLCADPELRTTPSGVSVCSVRLALDRRPDSDGNRGADYVTVVAWRTLATYLGRYYAKGQPVGVVGELRSRSYEGGDGVKRTVVEVLARDLSFVERKARSAAVAAPEWEVVGGADDFPPDAA